MTICHLPTQTDFRIFLHAAKKIPAFVSVKQKPEIGLRSQSRYLVFSGGTQTTLRTNIKPSSSWRLIDRDARLKPFHKKLFPDVVLRGRSKVGGEHA